MADTNAIINLDYDIIQQEAASISNCADTIAGIGKRVEDINYSLESAWYGSAQEKFSEELRVATSTTFPQMYKVCQEMSSLLTSTANSMKSADSSVGDAVRTALQEAIDSVFGN